MAEVNDLDIRKLKRKSIFSALKWMFWNILIGLAPLFILFLANLLLVKHRSETNTEITRLLEGGIIIFVCCTLMGAVLIDIQLEKIDFKKAVSFFLNTFPIAFILLVCFAYYLVVVGDAPSNTFSSLTLGYAIVILVTLVYCLVGKYHLYLNNEKKNQELQKEGTSI